MLNSLNIRLKKVTIVQTKQQEEICANERADLLSNVAITENSYNMI